MESQHFFNFNTPNHNRVDLTSFKLVVSLVLATFFFVFPLNSPLFNLRPDFIYLVAIYWALLYPQKFGLRFLFVCGIVTDLFSNYTLGIHAISYMLASFLVLMFVDERQKQNSAISYWIYASIAILLYSIILTMLSFWLHINRPYDPLLALIPAMICWFLIYLVLRPRVLQS